MGQHTEENPDRRSGVGDQRMMNRETSNQLVGALAQLNTDIVRQLATHNAAAMVYTDAKDKLDKSAKVLHELREAHFDLEFLLTKGRLPVPFEQESLTDLAPDGGDVRKRITDALLAPGVMQAAAELGDAVRATHPFESQTPRLFGETADGTPFEVGKGEELKDGSPPFDRVEALNKARDDHNWAKLNSLIARLAEDHPSKKILAATRRAYDAAKAEF